MLRNRSVASHWSLHHIELVWSHWLERWVSSRWHVRLERRRLVGRRRCLLEPGISVRLCRDERCWGLDEWLGLGLERDRLILICLILVGRFFPARAADHADYNTNENRDPENQTQNQSNLTFIEIAFRLTIFLRNEVTSDASSRIIAGIAIFCTSRASNRTARKRTVVSFFAAFAKSNAKRALCTACVCTSRAGC